MPEYVVTYPSGRRFTVVGALGTITHKAVWCPTVIEASGRAIVLDPRAVIRDGDGRVVFTGCSTEALGANTAWGNLPP